MGVLRLATHAMGTRFEIVLGGPRPERLRPAGEAAIAEIEQWHDGLSLFDAGSFVSYLNTHAAHRPVSLDDEVLDLLLECESVRRASDGAFDIAIAPLMRAWGFHDGASERDEIPAAGGDAVVIDAAERTIRFRRPDVAIDLGGVGKGHALDRAADVLREHDVETALLHGGTSTVVAIGAPPDAEAWRIRVAGSPERTIVPLRDEALSVSAPHGREVHVGGRRRGHVLDPRTRIPAECATLAAVVGPSARRADAWSTALLACGARPVGMPGDYASLVVTGAGLHTAHAGAPVFQIEEAAAWSGSKEVR